MPPTSSTLTRLDWWETLTAETQTTVWGGLSVEGRNQLAAELKADATARRVYDTRQLHDDEDPDNDDGYRLDPYAESWHPCTECVTAGGWEAGAVNEDGARCWPVADHQHGRPEQHFDWAEFTEWLYNAGRGAGKTRSAVEDRLELAMRYPRTTWLVIAPTTDDGRDYCFEGESGLHTIAAARGWEAPNGYTRSKLSLRLINGSRFIFRTGEKPDRIRGANCHGAWVDEPGTISKLEDVKRQLASAVRLPLPDNHPTTILYTGTPSRLPGLVDLIRKAQAAVMGMRSGRSLDNQANLSGSFVERIKQYAGTDWGRQEYEAVLLTAVEGALWNDDMIRAMTIEQRTMMPLLAVVAVDPAFSSKETADECGIVTMLMEPDGNHAQVVADDTRRGVPYQWAVTVIDAALKWQHPYTAQGVVIVLEANLTPEIARDALLVEMRKRGVSIQIVEVHATTSKQTRAEPIASLCTGADPKIRLVGEFPRLVDQLVSWITGMPSPNNLDAFVWAGRHLFAHLLDKAPKRTRQPQGPGKRPAPVTRNRW